MTEFTEDDLIHLIARVIHGKGVYDPVPVEATDLAKKILEALARNGLAVVELIS